MFPKQRNIPRPQKAVSLARALSKLGYCSRAQAIDVIGAARVKVNGMVWSNPACRVDLSRDRIEIDGSAIKSEPKIYLMLNKPRGLVTTRADEKGRATVFSCFNDPLLPRISPVGRLDKASQGMLLFTNDSQWAQRILAPENHRAKIYHVQIDRLADSALCQQLCTGVMTAESEHLAVKTARILRLGKRNSWLEIILDEGKNRQIRRILNSFQVNVLSLIRIAIGTVMLGNLPTGQYRQLSDAEIKALGAPNFDSPFDQECGRKRTAGMADDF